MYRCYWLWSACCKLNVCYTGHRFLSGWITVRSWWLQSFMAWLERQPCFSEEMSLFSGKKKNSVASNSHSKVPQLVSCCPNYVSIRPEMLSIQVLWVYDRSVQLSIIHLRGRTSGTPSVRPAAWKQWACMAVWPWPHWINEDINSCCKASWDNE